MIATPHGERGSIWRLCSNVYVYCQACAAATTVSASIIPVPIEDASPDFGQILVPIIPAQTKVPEAASDERSAKIELSVFHAFASLIDGR